MDLYVIRERERIEYTNTHRRRYPGAVGHGEPEGAPALILEILIREKRFKSRLESLNELHRAFAVKKKKEEREKERKKKT